MVPKKLPVVDIRDKSSDWLLPVQSSLINTQGVFFIKGMETDVFYILDKEDPEVLYDSWPAFSKLARRVCKMYMLATQHHPYELHTALDIYEGPQKSSTNLVRCFSPTIEPHIDRGAFNIVYGNKLDLVGLELLIRGEYWDVGEKFTSGSRGNDEFWGLVIPGYGLEAFDDCFKAVRHRVVNGSTEKRSVNFQCRLCANYRLPSGKTVDEAAAPVFACKKLKEEPDQFLVADIQSPCGAYRAILQADPMMTAEELKTVFVQQTQWGVEPSDLGLICHSGVGYFFEGSCLKDLAGDMDYPEPLRFTAHPRHKIA